MVCLGNICRSPLAHGILQDRITSLGLPWSVDSCGTSQWHVGDKPDKRSMQVASDKGIDISGQRARQFTPSDFDSFDHIIAMDASNYNNLKAEARSPEDVEKLSMLLNYVHPGENRQVPDPYYSGGFPFVFDMVAEAVDAFVQKYTDG